MFSLPLWIKHRKPHLAHDDHKLLEPVSHIDWLVGWVNFEVGSCLCSPGWPICRSDCRSGLKTLAVSLPLLPSAEVTGECHQACHQARLILGERCLLIYLSFGRGGDWSPVLGTLGSSCDYEFGHSPQSSFWTQGSFSQVVGNDCAFWSTHY